MRSPNIFICYRRGDGAGWAGRLHADLRARLGRKSQIFMDVDGIPPGEDFRAYIDHAIGECDAFIALIGPNWLDARGEQGRRRLDDPHDFVRLEIAAALKRNIRIIPILVGGARLPTAEELPEPLGSLVDRHAVSLDNETWDLGVHKIVGSFVKRSDPQLSRQVKWEAEAAGRRAELLKIGSIPSSTIRRARVSPYLLVPAATLLLVFVFASSAEHRVGPAATRYSDIGKYLSGIVEVKPAPILLTYNKPERLRVGTTTRQQVRIGDSAQFLASLDGLEGPGSVIRKKIIAGTRLRVQLISDPDAFKVLPISTEDQILVNNGAEWNWDVTPKRAGQHVLYIRISLRIPSGNTMETRDLKPIPLQIQSASNLPYTIVHFGAANWQFLLTALLLPVSAWIVRAIARRRKQRQQAVTPDGERKLEAQQSKTLWVPGKPRD